MSVVLIGMRGAGKSTLGRAAASRVGRKFVDVDEYLEEKWGCRVIEVHRVFQTVYSTRY